MPIVIAIRLQRCRAVGTFKRRHTQHLMKYHITPKAILALFIMMAGVAVAYRALVRAQPRDAPPQPLETAEGMIPWDRIDIKRAGRVLSAAQFESDLRQHFLPHLQASIINIPGADESHLAEYLDRICRRYVGVFMPDLGKLDAVRTEEGGVPNPYLVHFPDNKRLVAESWRRIWPEALACPDAAIARSRPWSMSSNYTTRRITRPKLRYHYPLPPESASVLEALLPAIVTSDEGRAVVFVGISYWFDASIGHWRFVDLAVYSDGASVVAPDA